jgi:glutathione S-transferase
VRVLSDVAKSLIDGNLAIWESHTILRYLAAAHAPALTGATPGERSMVERWMDFLLASLNAPYVAVFRDARKPPAERAGDFAAQSGDLVAQLKILDGHLAGRSFFALDRLTIADIALAPIVKRCLDFPVERPAFPELARWQGAIDARSTFAVAIGTKVSAVAAAVN